MFYPKIDFINIDVVYLTYNPERYTMKTQHFFFGKIFLTKKKIISTEKRPIHRLNMKEIT